MVRNSWILTWPSDPPSDQFAPTLINNGRFLVVTPNQSAVPATQTRVYKQGEPDDDIEFATRGWFGWYINRRLHLSIEYVAPVEFEAKHYAMKPSSLSEI